MATTELSNGLNLRENPEKLTENGTGSSRGLDPEVNGNVVSGETQVDKYGFTGGAQQYAGDSAEEVPTEVLRQREAKWLEMLNSWDKWMAKRHKKVKERCQKGIPPSLRGRAWLYLSGGKVKRELNQGKFQKLDEEQGDPKWVDIIERDLHRQFPFHEMFAARGGHGQQDLCRVLKAYTLYRPDEGYCQAQAPVAAVLLMHMPAEDAFWVLVQICEKYLPGYYSAGLEAIQLDGEILYALLQQVSSVAYRHLKKQKLEPTLCMTEWFMCIFSRTLPWASVLRIWDMFLCEGVKILFKVGLVLLKCTLGSQQKLKDCQGLYETMELLRAINPEYMQESFLVHEIIELTISETKIEKEHNAQLRRWKESHGDLRCKSPPRMHGAKAIMTSEPHSKQHLKQRPAIIVESPLAPKTDVNEENAATRSRKTKDEDETKTAFPSQELINPYAPSSDPSPLFEHITLKGSKESLSSAEQDTYL